jgi:hypothetical protein
VLSIIPGEGQKVKGGSGDVVPTTAASISTAWALIAAMTPETAVRGLTRLQIVRLRRPSLGVARRVVIPLSLVLGTCGFVSIGKTTTTAALP